MRRSGSALPKGREESGESHIRARLAGDLAEVEWRTLRPHAARDALILVDRGLDLLEVGVHVARDDADRVFAWVSEGALGKPDSAQLARWEGEPDRRFRVAIVQPYVLVQVVEGS